MVESLEGVNRVQNTGNIKPNENRRMNRRLEVESIQKNELSADELKEDLKDKIEDMNNIMEALEENLSFKLHDETERLMTQVIDIETQEVIKEMPPEEMLDLAAKIHRMVGLIIDEKV